MPVLRSGADRVRMRTVLFISGQMRCPSSRLAVRFQVDTMADVLQRGRLTETNWHARTFVQLRLWPTVQTVKHLVALLCVDFVIREHSTRPKAIFQRVSNVVFGAC